MYNDVLQKMTFSAFEVIDLTMDNYRQTVQAIQADEEKNRIMWQRDEDIRITYNKCLTPVPAITEEKAIEALMFKV